jgi:hypothetical protein
MNDVCAQRNRIRQDAAKRLAFGICYLAVGGAGLQQPIAKIELTEIMHWYQRLIYANQRASNCFAKGNRDAANLAVFCCVCVSTRCCGRLRLQSESSMPARRRMSRMDAAKT